MPIDPSIPLQAGNPSGPFGPNMAQVYASQNQAYRTQLQNQDLAGQNALRNVFSNPNALDPNTGLPISSALAPVFQANPQTGVDFLLATQKLQEQQNRSALTNMVANQKLVSSWDSSVAAPMINYAQEVQQKGLPQDQQQILKAQKQKELTDDWQRKNGITDSQRARFEKPYQDDWAVKSDAFRKHQVEFAKTWKDDNLDYSQDPPVRYSTSSMAPGLAFKPDHVSPYSVGSYSEPEKSPKPLGAPLQAQVKQPDGSFAPGQVYVHPGGRITNPANETINPEDVKDIQPPPRAAATKADKLGPTETLRIRGSDGKITPTPAQAAPHAPGTPAEYYNLKGEKIDPATIVETKVPASVADRPEYSDKTVDFKVGQALAGDPAAIRNIWGAPQLKVQIENALSERADELWGYHPAPGEDPKDPAVRKKIKEGEQNAGANMAALNAMFLGQEGALRSLDRLKANVQSFEGTALREANLALSLAPKGLAGSGVPALNRWIQAGRKSIEGDSDVTSLDAALISLKNEYARIMSSPGATGGQTSDHARAEAEGLLNRAMTPQQLADTIGVMKASMGNRIASINTQIGSTIDDIRTGGGVSTPLSEPPANPASQPVQGRATIPPASSNLHSTMDDAIAAMRASPNRRFEILNKETGKKEIWVKGPDGTPHKEVGQ